MIKWTQNYLEGLIPWWGTPYHYYYIAAKRTVSEQLLGTIIKLYWNCFTTTLPPSFLIAPPFQLAVLSSSASSTSSSFSSSSSIFKKNLLLQFRQSAHFCPPLVSLGITPRLWSRCFYYETKFQEINKCEYLSVTFSNSTFSISHYGCSFCFLYG